MVRRKVGVHWVSRPGSWAQLWVWNLGGWGWGQGNRERLVKRYKLSAVRGIRSEDVMYDMVTVVDNTVLQN